MHQALQWHRHPLLQITGRKIGNLSHMSFLNIFHTGNLKEAKVRAGRAQTWKVSVLANQHFSVHDLFCWELHFKCFPSASKQENSPDRL